MNHYKNNYRQDTSRLNNWDYSFPSAYFITICTKDREYYFGDIKNNVMKFTEIGRIANEYFSKIPIRYPNTTIDKFIVMPNHLHGLIIISDKNGNYFFRENLPKPEFNAQKRVTIMPLKTSSPKHEPTNTNKFGGLISNSLSSIINHYKGDVTKYARNKEIEFQWQGRFFDRVVKNKNEFYRIKNYIRANPKNWEKDTDNPNNILM